MDTTQLDQPSRLDRQLQRNILNSLLAWYPATGSSDVLGLKPNDPSWTFNAAYLEEHGLLTCSLSEYLDGGLSLVAPRITARGIDFLQDDGGLTAILGVVTVRLEAETLKALLAAKVDASDLPAEEKSKLKAGLQKLGGDALSKISGKLLDKAVENLPLALELLRNAVT